MASKITQAMREQVLADYDACKHIATVAKQNGLSEPTIRKIIVQERGENAISHKAGAASASVTARCTATNEEISQIVRESFQYFKRSCVKTDEECADRLNDYFRQCVDEGQIPTVEDMCLALGAVNQTVLDWQKGSMGPVRAEMMKKAKQILAGIDAKLVSQGKIPQITYIFRAKNFFGMTDKQEVVLTPNNPLGAETPPEELQKKYIEAASCDYET